ncbi:predicted protein [Verticillium alfalfae VaMs.102]|uniref:Predicted protein n=1 Tax=Verticillium alfalfae (strain VaMs.102 / ATCC MYA-4576 / FGSC 10136) TaxID=526221 RepID=C9SL99_VERA1|nr:predicted protein [Verticillium alfalfae VaMs.102]EEY19467.1 predicted protein [Verticillium alfalfae VaMs.102]
MARSALNPKSALFIPGRRHHGYREHARIPVPERRKSNGLRTPPAKSKRVPASEQRPPGLELSWWPTPEQAARPVPTDLHITMKARAAAATAAAAAATALCARRILSGHAVQYPARPKTPGIICIPLAKTGPSQESASHLTPKDASSQAKTFQSCAQNSKGIAINSTGITRIPTSQNFEPPADAPKGPAAWRDAQVTANHLVQQTPNIISPIPRSTVSDQPDLLPSAQSGSAASPVPVSIKPTGAWSQSKAWVSERSRQQAAFKKVQANLGRINAGDSPAVPRTLAEFLELKKWKAKRDQRCLLRKISLLEMNQGSGNMTSDASISLISPNSTDETDEGGKAASYPSNDTTQVPKADNVAENEGENLDKKDDKGTLGASGTSSERIATEIPKPPDIGNIMLRRLLDGKTFEDNRSPVFASDTCWNISYSDSSGIPVQRRVDWPSKTDLQEYGDMRSAAGMRRSLPPPCENRLTSRLANIVHNESRSLHARLKNIRLDRLGIGPCDHNQVSPWDGVGMARQPRPTTLAREQGDRMAQPSESSGWVSALVDTSNTSEAQNTGH